MLQAITRRWRRFKRGEVRITSRGFEVQPAGRAKPQVMDWADAIKIEVCREPSFTTWFFYVVMTSKAKSILVDEDMIGFDSFKEAVMARWPIEAEWTNVWMGPPLDFETATLWRAS